tara:strand:- start:285 stop:725 length:441 start_codon:yes stop_codon:yes gene_type:complete
MDSNIILTTSEVSFMGGFFDDNEAYEHAHKRTAIIAKKHGNGDPPCNPNHHLSIYYDGKLENEMGYDIPCLISGTVPELKDGDILPVNTVTLDDKKFDAVMLVGVYTDRSPEFLHALIMTIDDAEIFLSDIETDSNSGISFKALVD